VRVANQRTFRNGRTNREAPPATHGCLENRAACNRYFSVFMTSHQGRSILSGSRSSGWEGASAGGRWLVRGSQRPAHQTVTMTRYEQVAATILTESTLSFGPAALEAGAPLGGVGELDISSTVPVISTL
jgi:hypothetical protein